MRYSILLICLFLTALTLNAQTFNDSILVNERKIDRPLTLHKGQLQFNPAYEISILSKEYDNSSNSINLADEGTASVLHKYFFEFNYGILDFLQASITLNYAKRGERHETRDIYVLLNTLPDFEITYFDDYKGFEDFYLGTVIKLPLKTKKIEIAVSPGFYIPLFSNNPKAPENSISFPSDGQPYTKIIYHNNYNVGNGSKVIKIGTSAIVRPINDFSILAKLNYSWPISESETIRWIHQLNGSTFVYDDIPYKYLIGNTLDYEVILAYQAISWFNVSLSYYYKKTFSGWSEITGFRIGNPESKLSLLSIGYEIKATSKLWINEFIDIPVSGKNQLAPFSIYLGISYNLFPFNRKLKPGQFNNTVD
jgi:hypothetical protein